MNCLDFHRQLLSDPYTSDAAVQSHEAECRSCANFAREVRGQEVKLRALLQEVSPPQGLAERVALKPNSAGSWRKYAEALEALGDLHTAAEASRRFDRVMMG